MKLLMALAVLVGSALPDVRVVGWWGLDRLDRADRPGTGREFRRSPVDRGLGLALSWRCCFDDVDAVEAMVFEGHDASIDEPIDEMSLSLHAAEWASPVPPATGSRPSGAGSDPPQPEEGSNRPRFELGRTGLSPCVGVCPDSRLMDLIAADEARALAALRSVGRHR